MDAKNNKLIVTLLLVLCLFFLGVGIYTINEAHHIYQYSLNTKIDGKIAPRYEAFKDGYTLAQTFFLIAAGFLIVALVLPRLQSFSFGGVSITLRTLSEQVEELKKEQHRLQQSNIDIAQQQNMLQQSNLDESLGGKKAAQVTKDTIAKVEIPAPLPAEPAPRTAHPDDPQKGRWGGLPQVGNRQLSAQVFRSLIPGLYEVELTVRSTDRNDPISGLVTFHLHDSFRNQDPVIAVIDNEATLKLRKVYGAFTVGAETDGGKTKLELDLAQLPLPRDVFGDFLDS